MMKGVKSIWSWLIAVVFAVVLFAVGKRRGWFGGGYEVVIDEEEIPGDEPPLDTWIDPEIETGTSTNSTGNTPRVPQKPAPKGNTSSAEKTVETVAKLFASWLDENDEDEQAFDILLGLNDTNLIAVSQAWAKVRAKPNRSYNMAFNLRTAVQDEVVWGSKRAHVLVKKNKVLERLNTLKIN
jgi:hypothetical protein